MIPNDHWIGYNLNMSTIKKTLRQAFPAIEKQWDKSIIPTLIEYIKIPNKSIHFDKDWESHGYMDQAMNLLVDWCQANPLDNMQLDVIKQPGRTPLLFIDVPGPLDHTTLLYGHMDKQPEMEGWDENKGPWKPVIENGKLYGRGAADDGYSVFAAMTAIRTLQTNNIPHGRCVIIIEGSEESGSMDLIHYLEQLKERIGSPNLIICLDSSAGNYQQLWGTTSLRGLLMGELTIQVLNEGQHSGVGSGVTPSVFSILRQLISRIEDSQTGQMTLASLQVDIPKDRLQQARETADNLGDSFFEFYDFHDNTQPIDSNIAELLLNRSWRPSLSVIGIDGIPNAKNAGNVTLPKLTVKLSVRTPPTLDLAKASHDLKKVLEASPPFQASIRYTPEQNSPGWNAPVMADWLVKVNNEASELFFQQPAAYIGEGGSIPFMGILGDMFPGVQFMITGLLGPKSNAHGPNEFLAIDYAKKLTACVAYIIANTK